MIILMISRLIIYIDFYSRIVTLEEEALTKNFIYHLCLYSVMKGSSMIGWRALLFLLFVFIVLIALIIFVIRVVLFFLPWIIILILILITYFFFKRHVLVKVFSQKPKKKAKTKKAIKSGKVVDTKDYKIKK